MINKHLKILSVCISVLLIAFGAFYLYNVYREKPVEDTLNGFFTEMKNGDIEGAGYYIEGNDQYKILKSELNDVRYKDLADLILSKTEYKIGRITVNGSEASADVYMETVDLFGFYNKYCSSLNPLIEMYISGTEVEKYLATEKAISFLKSVVPQDAGSNPVMNKGNVKIGLILKDGKWIIRPDESLINQLSGNMALFFGKIM
ncbi:MAG: hypothetical protein AB9844_11610 [Clostridiaceae bacterium]